MNATALVRVELTPGQRLYLLRLVERQQFHFGGKFDNAIAVTHLVREFESAEFFVDLLHNLSTASQTIATRG